jgi:hypothetical protein
MVAGTATVVGWRTGFLL